jgi:hypothetical protein
VRVANQVIPMCALTKHRRTARRPPGDALSARFVIWQLGRIPSQTTSLPLRPIWSSGLLSPAERKGRNGGYPRPLMLVGFQPNVVR